MQVEIWERAQVDAIPISEWDELAQQAIEKNPFYESWNLLAALKWLDSKANIKIITIRINKQLVCLFPIKLIGKIPHLRILSIWKHNHCFLTTPLVSKYLFPTPAASNHGIWKNIFLELQIRLKTIAFYANTHGDIFSLQGFAYFSRQFHRPSVKNPKTWEIYESDIPSKRKKEYRRICKRIETLGELNFNHDMSTKLEPVMQEFIKLEASGWKGVCGDALAKQNHEREYYLHLIKNAESSQKVAFNVLELDQQAIAISFGYHCQNMFFEIKTAYAESHKKHYPGIILELKNLANYSHHHYQEVDSCTDPDNFVISRMWPDKKSLRNSWGFRYAFLRRFFCLLYPHLRKFLNGRLAKHSQHKPRP